MASYITPERVDKVIPEDCVCGLHLNIRSLRKHHDDLLNLLTSANRRFQFIGLTETWLLADECNLYCLEGYYIEASCRGNNDQHHSGGACLFISEEISYNKRLDLCVDLPNCESVFVEVSKGFLSSVPSNVIIGVVYRSPSSSYAQFCSVLDELLSKITDEKKMVILMGDINTDITDFDCVTCEDYVNCYTTYGVKCLVKLPTRVTLDSSTTIDHILTNCEAKIDGGVILAEITDHYPVFFYLRHIRNTNQEVVLQKLYLITKNM